MTIATTRENPVLARLDEMCENGVYEFNDFPQGEVDIIRTETDPFRIFHQGLLSGAKQSVFGQARVKQMPLKVRKALGLENANEHSVWTVYFYLDQGDGQGHKGQQNLIAVFPHSYKSGINAVTVVSIGCKHDYQSRTVGRCAYTFTCSKCGFEMFRDSSD